MAICRWTPRDARVAQVNTITPGSVGVGNLFTVTINNKAITYAAAAATAADVSAGLVALIQASTEGEFESLTATDLTGTLTLTANTPGQPFTQTSSASGGSATLSTSTTTANVSANDVNDGLNWSTGGTPANTNDLIIDVGGSTESLTWNLGSLSAITLNSMTRRASFTGTVGLDELNTDESNSYWEYRPTELAIGATTALIEQATSDGAESFKWNAGSVQTALTVLGQGAGSIGSEAMWFRGTNSSNVVNVINGSLAVAPVGNLAATIATLHGEGATIRCGANVTLTTVDLQSCTCEFNSNITTLTQKGSGSTTTTKGTMTITTADIYEGTLVVQSTGTITTLNPGGAATIDFSQATGSVTVTGTVTLYKGVTISDPQGRVTWGGTPSFTLGPGVRLGDVTLDVGTGRNVTIG